MRKVVLTYGILAGVIIAMLMVISGSLASGFDENNSYSMLQGYATMIISLSLVFFAVKSYRDNYSGGQITFWKGFQVALGVTAIASVFYTVGWDIYSSIAMPNWVDHYAQHEIDAVKQSGATAQAIVQKTKEMADMKEMYKNPFFKYGEPLVEILPVGLLISAISAAILRRRSVVRSGEASLAT